MHVGLGKCGLFYDLKSILTSLLVTFGTFGLVSEVWTKWRLL